MQRLLMFVEPRDGCEYILFNFGGVSLRSLYQLGHVKGNDFEDRFLPFSDFSLCFTTFIFVLILDSFVEGHSLYAHLIFPVLFDFLSFFAMFLKSFPILYTDVLKTYYTHSISRLPGLTNLFFPV